MLDRKSVAAILIGLTLALAADRNSAIAADQYHGWESGLTGNTLLSACQGAGGDTGHGLCSGFISGFMTGISVSYKTQCIFYIPENVTGEQLEDIMVKSLVEHPETRNKPAFQLIYETVRRVFPCP